jgi:solute carrier family 25 iron transporter 28/37
MMAGALAGISEHAVMFPVDSIKTRMQVYSTSPQAIYSGMTEAFTRISSTEGAARLWRGVGSVILGAGPAHAVHFGTYEAIKDWGGGNESGAHVGATGAFFACDTGVRLIGVSPSFRGCSSDDSIRRLHEPLRWLDSLLRVLTIR